MLSITTMTCITAVVSSILSQLGGFEPEQLTSPWRMQAHTPVSNLNLGSICPTLLRAFPGKPGAWDLTRAGTGSPGHSEG